MCLTLIDSGGQFVILPRFEWAYGFSEGLAAVRSNWQWGYIDHRGEYVVQPQFEDAHPFENNRAQVRLDGVWSWIDKEGQLMPTNNN